MNTKLDTVIQFFHEQQERGITHVMLDDDAKNILRQLHIQVKEKKKSIDQKKNTNRLDFPLVETEARDERENIYIPLPTPIIKIEGNTKVDQLAALKKITQDWVAKNHLTTLRTKMVFSSGNQDAKIMLIGDCPSYHDESSELPFQGSTGEMLDKILSAMSIKRDDVYLAQIVKFRPSIARQTTNNRSPNQEELTAFIPLLAAEISIIKPQVIIALGSISAAALVSSRQSFDELRNQWHNYQGISLRVTENPALLLTANNNKKRPFWEDMLAVMKMISLPISEKQKGYFS
jgi:uracil-DNA glycosylase